MSDEERTGFRPLLYSRWHRVASTRRYLSNTDANRLAGVDIDFCEACEYCKRPVALIETEKSARKRRPKNAQITANLANAAMIPAYSVIYVPGLPLIHCDECGKDHEDPDDDNVLRFYVRQIHPASDHVAEMAPSEYASWLLSLRTRCLCRVNGLRRSG